MSHPILQGITTLQNFKNATAYRSSSVIGQARYHIVGQGRKIEQVYRSLEKVEEAKASGKTSELVQRLWELCVDCSDWLDDHAAKKPANPTPRPTEVKKLNDAAKLAFEEISFKSRAFNANKAGANKPTPVHLSGAYALERKAYESNGKAFALAAHPILQANPNVATVDDYIKTYESIKQGNGAANRVQYLKQRDRLEYLVVLENGRFYGENNQLKNSPATGTSTTVYGEMYAMDRHGNLFVRDYGSFGGPRTGFGYFNHSSFNAGREVICAGVCLFKNGALVFANNESGHYRPTRDHLQAMLAFLASRNCDLSATRVDVYGTSEHHVGSNFVHNPKGKANWDPKLNTSWPSDKAVSG